MDLRVNPAPRSLKIQYKQKKIAYCQIIGNQRFLSTKFNITIDYGEERGLFEDTRLRDEQTGKIQKFNSMVDALNFMCNNGWEFVDSYIVQIDRINYYHWLLKKKQ